MAVPVHKLPELLRVPFLLPNFTRMVFCYPIKRFGGNNPRHYYKTQGPNIKYYNTHMQVELLFQKDVEPKIEIYRGETLVGVIPNTVPAEEIPNQLRKLHDPPPA